MRVGEGTSRLFKRVAYRRDSSEGVSQTLQKCGSRIGQSSRGGKQNTLVSGTWVCLLAQLWRAPIILCKQTTKQNKLGKQRTGFLKPPCGYFSCWLFLKVKRSL